MTPRRKTILILAAVFIGVLLTAPTALAAAGGGTFNFGGGGGGSGSGGGGFGGGGGHGHSAFEIYIIVRLLLDIARLGHGAGLLVLIGIALAIWFFRSVLPKMRTAAEARREQGQAHTAQARRRERQVELAAAEAADENPIFDPQQVRADAAKLFTDIQLAWDAGDRIRLRGLIAPGLLAEWERRLDEFDRQGWRNRVEPLAPPTVEYLGLARESQASADRVTVRIEARMRDYVSDASGRHIKRRGQFTETVRLREYWTLQRRDDRWILASIEQGGEGTHALTDKLAPTAWSDEQRLRDEALVEQASADAPPSSIKTTELADLDFAGDARAAANDLSVADGRFAPDILAVAARRAVGAWLEAIDGSDGPLKAIAAASAVDYLLYQGDATRRTRVVIRGAQVERIEIAALDASAEPPTMTIDVHIRGRRYLQDRDTTQVIAGDPARDTRFTERWTLVLTDDPQQPWRIMFVTSPAVAA